MNEDRRAGENAAGAAVHPALVALTAGVDALLGAQLAALAAVEYASLVAGVETQRRRLEQVDAVLLAGAENRRLAGDYGRASTADLLVDLTRVSPREARARVMRSRDVGPRFALNGESLGPLFPLASAALEEGSVSAAHVKVIVACVEAIPAPAFADETTAELAHGAEAALVEHARHLGPTDLKTVALRMLAYLDPDGERPREDEIARRRDLTLVVHPDGSATIAGTLTAQAAAVWAPIIGALSAPEPADDGLPDPRTAGQRRHDGFLDAGQRLLRSDLPTAGGAPVTIIATVDAASVLTATGRARLEDGQTIATADLLGLAGGADLFTAVLDPAGGIMCFGRTRRVASVAQRRLLAARDRGCTFPGCTRPPSWTEAHHVIPWQDGGPTDLDNLCLLCTWHHREFERRGWQVTMSDGVPLWTPPAWLDPERRPRRNTAHHLDDRFLADLAAHPAAASACTTGTRDDHACRGPGCGEPPSADTPRIGRDPVSTGPVRAP